MAEPICEDEGLLQEWSPITQLLQKIPLKVQKGLFSQNLNLTCLDVISEYIALGTNSYIVYWYSRVNGELQRLRLENSNSEVTCVKVVSTVDYMVAAGTNQGTIIVFQIPKLVPESIPHQLKPKKRQIERFTINGLHNSPITNIEWSQNGMRLFSGDKNGLVVLTEIDFSMHLSKSSELISEQYEIVQLSYNQQLLLISTIYRSVVCDGSNNWKVCQVGTKERKILGKFGAALCKFDHDLVIYACRPGYRLWLADKSGSVQQTLIFKSAVHSTCPKIQLINPMDKKQPFDTNFGKVLQFAENKLIAYNSEVLYVLHPGAVSVTSALCNVRKIIDLAVNENEIFILEGERSLLRISPVPDKYALELNPLTSSRKSVFNLDEFATKIKDTAVDSLRKITKDLLPMTEQASPNSPPAVADDALELPPIVYLPDGTVPRILSEKIEIESPSENDWYRSPTRENFAEKKGKEYLKSNSNFPFEFPSNNCQEEIITRPLRKKHCKPPKKKSGFGQVLKSKESDTLSSVSDDRLTWGVTNDLSMSDESAMTQSHSSFSILPEFSPAMMARFDDKLFGQQRKLSGEDCKSQTSIDTCESVSECLVTNSEKFREEQEKRFARLANRYALDGYNSDKTENMSISLNTGNSSNVQSPTSEFSENLSSPASPSKTTESRTYDNDTEEKSAAMENNDGSSDHQEVGKNCTEETLNLARSFVLEKESEKENLQSKNFTLEAESHERCDGATAQSDTENDKCSFDFGIKNLSDFYSHEVEDENFNEFIAKDKIENGFKEKALFNANNQINPPSRYEQPYSYGPPSGSSQSSLQPLVSMDFPSKTGQKSKIFRYSDYWPQFKTPEPITSLSASRNYIMCTDINDRVYYSNLSGMGLTWVLLDYKASSIRVSYDGSIIWFMINKCVCSLVNPSPKRPVAAEVDIIEKDAISFSVDPTNNDGWIVTSDGKVVRFTDGTNDGQRTRENVPLPTLVTDVASFDGTVFVLTVNEQILCKPSGESEFRQIKASSPITTALAVGPNNLLWAVDDKNVICFSDDFLSDNPHWWQIQISDYLFQNSNPPSFQNIYSKIKLNNLKSNLFAKGNAYVITANENSIWIGEKFSTMVRVNKSNFAGYLWSRVFSQPSLSCAHWITLSGEGVFEDKGHVWLLASDGNIFSASPKSNHIQAVPVPCDDEVLCIAASSDTLWVLSKTGSIYSRLGLSDTNLSGNSWRELKLPQIDNLRLIWVSCGCDVAWGCDVYGRTFMTIGSPHHMATNIFDAAWLEVEGRPKGVRFVKVFVGPQMYMVWAIDIKGNLYVREGIFSYFQIGTSWVYVGGIEAVHVSISGTSMWALTPDGAVYRRCGISERNYIGDYWKIIPGIFKTITSSFTDDLWGITQDNKIMRLNYRVKIFDKEKLEEAEKETETLSSKKDIGWEIIE